jgi:4-alpha-glucanotransferase
VPSEAFFDTLVRAFGDLSERAFAEDIGHITDAVDELRARYGLASLKLLPFVDWCEDGHPHKPHRYTADTVAYTSTHDSETARGAYESLSTDQRVCFDDYFGGDVTRETVHETCIGAVWESDASLALAQVQDVLGLGNDARFNVPGTTADNWAWRVREEQLTDAAADWLAGVTRDADRAGG